MTNLLMIALAALHLEGNDLFVALVLDHIGNHTCAIYSRQADRDFAIIVHEQHAVEGDWLTSFHFQMLDFEFVARANAVLFASSFDDCVHKAAPFKRDEEKTRSTCACQWVI